MLTIRASKIWMLFYFFIAICCILPKLAISAVVFSTNPAIGSRASGNVIWLRADSISSSGLANFTIGKDSGPFSTNGMLKVFVNGAELTSLQYSKGNASASFLLQFSPDQAGNYTVRVQRYDTVSRQLDPNVVSGVINVIATQPQPVLNSVSRTSGTVGETAQIDVYGSNFPSTLIINIGGQNQRCQALSFSASQGRFACPLDVPGTHLLEVKTNTNENGGYAFWKGNFVVNAPIPVVQDFSPKSGQLGQTAQISVTGNNFPSTLIVNIADQRQLCTRKSVSTTQGVFLCPLDVAGDKQFVIKTDISANGGKEISSGRFNVLQPGPIVTDHTPKSGQIGQTAQITVTGNNFPSTLIVNIGDQRQLCTRKSVSTTQGVFLCPLDVAGDKQFVIKTDISANGGREIGSGRFNVQPATPSVSDYAPKSGQAGQTAQITVTGNNFPSTLIVNIADQRQLCTRKSVSTTQGVFLCPLDVAGDKLFVIKTDISANGGREIGSGRFNVQPATPSVSDYAPKSGQAGQTAQITVTGNNFPSTLIVNIADQRQLCTRKSVSTTEGVFLCPLDAAGDKQFVIKTDIGANGGREIGSGRFNVQPATPSVSDYAPKSGQLGQTAQITVKGNNFPPTLIVNIADQRQLCTRKSVSTTEGVFLCPLDVAGDKLFVIKTDTDANGGKEISSGRFNVLQPGPIVTDYTPKSGQIGQTAQITVTGNNFPSTLIVNIGDQRQLCTRKSVSTTQGVFLCPLDVVGDKLFVIKTDIGANGGKEISSGRFNVLQPGPIVTDYTPKSGQIGQTAQITVTGNNFPSTLIVNIADQRQLCTRKSVSTTQGVFLCPLDVAGDKLFVIKTDTDANGGKEISSGRFNVQQSGPQVQSVTPLAARLDVAQTYVVKGSGLTSGMGFAIEDCEPESGPGPIPEVGVGTPEQRAFRCIPRLPGPKRLVVKNAPGGKELYNATVVVEHPARQGRPERTGMPSALGVSLWNGNVFLENTDLTVPGKGVSFSLSRSYNSHSSSLVGARGGVTHAAPWRFNWDLKIGYVTNTGKQQLWVQREDGSGESFFKADGVWYALDQGNFNQIKGDTPVKGQTTLFVKNGLKYVFQNPDLGGLLVGVFDHDGNGLKVSRDAASRVSRVLDASDRAYDFTYDGNGRLSRVTDFSGRYVEYAWESGPAAGDVRLSSVRDVRGGLTRYSYARQTMPGNEQTLLTGVTDARNKLVRSYVYTSTVYGNWGAASASDGEKNTWNFKYCAKQPDGNCSSDPITAVEFQTEVSLPLAGRTHLARFNSGGRLLSYQDSNRRTVNKDYLNFNTLDSKNYRQAGLPTQLQSGKAVEQGYAMKLEYTADNAGNLARVVNEENQASRYEWLDSPALREKNLHRPKALINAKQQEYRFGFTDSGNLQSYAEPGLPAVQLQRDASGLLTQVADARNNISSRSYNVHGDLLSENDPYNNRVRYVPDRLGRVIEIYDKRNNLSKNTWDAAGNLLSSTDALNQTTSYEYDENNNRTLMRDARNNVTRYSYDGNNRLLSISRAIDGKTVSTSYLYDALGRVISVTNANNRSNTTQFDGEGNATSRANALKFTSTYEYDADNRQVRSTDPEGRITETAYDKAGRVTEVKTSAGSTRYSWDENGRMRSRTDARNNTTQYEYDAAGRLVKVIDANQKESKAAYDANGNLISVTDPNNNTTNYEWDKLNRQVLRRDPNGQEWRSVYDENGNIVRTIAPGNLITRNTFDALNRLVQVNYPDASMVSYTYDQNGNRLTMTDSTGVTRYAYDALNRLSSKTDPLGKSISYKYDGVGNLLELAYPNQQAVRYSYDAADRLSGLTDWLGKSTSYTLNKAGQVTLALLGNGARTEMEYNAAGRLSSLLNKKPDGGIISSHVLTMDGNGNITNAQTQLPLEPSIGNVERSFTYDAANRMATFNGNAVQHDAAGRMTAIDGAQYSYNARDQISRVAGKQSASHEYNGDGHRVLRNLNGQTSRFVIDANRELPEVLAEMDANGNLQRNYIYGYGLVAQISNTNVASYYHFDPSGNTLALSNQAGVVTDSYAYTPYGETTRSGSTPNPFRFVGKFGVMDDDNGLHFMRARYYRADVGRFLSLDRVLGNIGNPQTLNRYAYVMNNPITGIDPSGYFCELGSSCFSFLEGIEETLRPFAESPVMEALITEDARKCTTSEDEYEIMMGCGNIALNFVPISKIGKIGKIDSVIKELDMVEDAGKAIESVAMITKKASTKGVDFYIDKGISGTYSFIDSTGKLYVGQSVDVLRRLKEHFRTGKLTQENIKNIVVYNTGDLPKRGRELVETTRMKLVEAMHYSSPELKTLLGSGKSILSNLVYSFKSGK
ncbi:IPT/TIG domain-containing protein [Massilia sp. W12]|uniref:IPT/TIG domain-containing protein n=1 Tax=Massilia sp. W12 TaxID=3126507 RepID=UPI0030CFAA6C